MKVISINNNNNLNFEGFVEMYNYNKNRHSHIKTTAEQDKALTLLFDEYLKSDKLGINNSASKDYSLSEMLFNYKKPLSERQRYFDYHFSNFTKKFERILKGVTLPVKSKSGIKACTCRSRNIEITGLFKLKHCLKP